MSNALSEAKASFRLRRGMSFGLGQALITAASQLVVIRILIGSNGIEALGLWALVTAICAPLRLADFSGLSSSYFVARSIASEERDTDTAAYIHFNMLASLGLMSVSALVLYLLSPFAVSVLLTSDQTRAVLDILPIVMFSTIAQSLSLNLSTALDGLQRSFLRSSAVILGTLCYFAVSVLLIERLGIVSLAVGQIAMAVVTTFVSAFFLARHLPIFSVPDWRMAGKKLREIFGYGARMQSVSWSQALFEPAVRIALGNSGGLLLLGAYEVAQRVLGQGRSLVFQMLYPLVPAITHLSKVSRSDANAFIWVWHKRCALGSLLLSPIVLLMADLVASLVIGTSNSDFHRTYYLLSIPTWCAISTFPLYYIGPATSLFKWNALGHAAALLALPLLAFGFHFIGAKDSVVLGAVLASTVAVVISSTANVLASRMPFARHFMLVVLVLCILSAMNLTAYINFK